MIVYRLCNRQYSDLDGEGARLAGGRWNLMGTPAVYTSEHTALAICENLVHFKKNQLPKNYVVITIELPDDSISREFEIFNFSHKDSTSTGNKWLIDKDSLAIKVPSIIVPKSYNYIINPKHNDMQRVKIMDITDFSFDNRFKKST